MDSGEQVTENKDEHRTLARVLHNALQEADTCAGYALDAEVAGNANLADFFRDVQRTHVRVAERVEGMLGVRGDDAQPADVRSNAIPAEAIRATSRRVKTFSVTGRGLHEPTARRRWPVSGGTLLRDQDA